MKKSIFFIVLFSFIFSAVHAQELKFQPAFAPSLFSQTPISLLQDRRGFLWIGTTDGVYRYDGNVLTEYRHDPLDSNSISNNYVRKLYEDSQGQIWMGTQLGLNVYSPQRNNFKRIPALAEIKGDGANHILAIREDHKGNIWYGTYDGLFEYNIQTKNQLHFLPNSESEYSLSNKLIWSILEDSKKNIWLGTQDGFTKFRNDGKYEFQPFLSSDNAIAGLNTDRIFDIEEQDDGTIWMSSYDGIFKVIMVESEMEFQHIRHFPNRPQSLSSNTVNQLYFQGNEKLWAPTIDGGLNEIALNLPEEGNYSFVHHLADEQEPTSIRINQVNKMLIDDSQMMWVATANGLDKASASANKFEHIISDANNEASLSHGVVKSIYKDSRGNLWVGTYNGLNFLPAEKYVKGNYAFEHFFYEKNNRHSLTNNNITDIQEDGAGYLWITTHKGVTYCNIEQFEKDKKFAKIIGKDGLPHTLTYSVQQMEKDKYWVATYGGLAQMHFDPDKSNPPHFTHFNADANRQDALVNSNCSKVILDKFNNYWIGTFHGVSNLVNADSPGFFQNYKHDQQDSSSLSNNSFRCFYKDSKQRLWIGTRSGLNLVQQKSANQEATFRVFNSRHGFKNDVIHAIAEDEAGHLWLTTNKGLVQFDPEQMNGQPVLRTYAISDGLKSSSFVYRAVHKDNDGLLYFGYAGGLIIFDPAKMKNNSYQPPIHFTGLTVLNKEVLPGPADRDILKTAIDATKEIELKHWQNLLSLEFAALDYNHPEKNKYKYKLSSLHTEWVDNGFENTVSFTNLPAGNHELLVLGSNNDGVWASEPARLMIKVLPPIWKTWWAYLIYALTALALLYSFIQFRIRQKVAKVRQQAILENARREERELLREKNAADFHDELGNRFTKIALFLELAERESSSAGQLKMYLQKIKINAQELSQGLKDLTWTLDPKKDTLFQTMMRLQEFGDQLFDFSPTSFKTNGIESALEPIDLSPNIRKHVLMIFKEAMNNCLKYAQANVAELTVNQKAQHIEIKFSDDGIGYDAERINSGNGLINMQSRAKKINAQLIRISAPDQGTEIRLILKSPIRGTVQNP